MDDRDRAAQFVGDGFEALMDNIEAALRDVADEYDVEPDQEAIEAVQDDFYGSILLCKERGDDDIDWLVDEMSDPESEAAHSNIKLAVKRKGREADHGTPLRSLGLAIVVDNRL